MYIRPKYFPTWAGIQSKTIITISLINRNFNNR